MRQARNDGDVIYAGAQEVEPVSGGVRVKTYWPNGIGMEIEQGGTTQLNWLHVDRLGSPVAITAEDGTIRADGKLEYDAWGKRRSATDNASIDDTIDGKIDNRGFTGHEMLDQLDLVHMNGRVYDPLISKFMSGDPLITDPMNGQRYNRYSYVLNNPTNLTDPTGFCEAPTGTAICGGSPVGQKLEVSPGDTYGSVGYTVAAKAGLITPNGTITAAGNAAMRAEVANISSAAASSANSKTYFIGGAADKYQEFGQGPTNIMGDVQAKFAKEAPAGAESAYYGYQDRKEIVDDIVNVHNKDASTDINLVGHSRGGALAINIAANELANSKIEVNLLIAIDPVGSQLTTPSLWIPAGPLSNVRNFININARASAPDITDRIAWAGGAYREKSASLTQYYFNVNNNHGQAYQMLKAPIALPFGQTPTAWDALMQNVR